MSIFDLKNIGGFLGLWEYELVDRKIINIYYDVFFYTMLQKEKLVICFFLHILYILYLINFRRIEVALLKCVKMCGFQCLYCCVISINLF